MKEDENTLIYEPVLVAWWEVTYLHEEQFPSATPVVCTQDRANIALLDMLSLKILFAYCKNDTEEHWDRWTSENSADIGLALYMKLASFHFSLFWSILSELAPTMRLLLSIQIETKDDWTHRNDTVTFPAGIST